MLWHSARVSSELLERTLAGLAMASMSVLLRVTEFWSLVLAEQLHMENVVSWCHSAMLGDNFPSKHNITAVAMTSHLQTPVLLQTNSLY